MNERLEPARAQADNEMMDDMAEHAHKQQDPLHRADILAQAVINDGNSYKARLSAARAVWLTREDKINGPVYVNMQFAHALYLCRQEAARSIYEGMRFSLPVRHDAAAQVVDYMRIHLAESNAPTQPA